MRTIKIEQPYAWLVVTNQINEVWVDKEQEKELTTPDNECYVQVYAIKGGPMAWALERYYRSIAVYKIRDDFLQERQCGVWHCPNDIDKVIGKVMIRYIFYDENLDLLHVTFEYNTGLRI